MASRKSERLSIVSAVMPLRGLVMRMTLIFLLFAVGATVIYVRSNEEHVSMLRAEVMDIVTKVVDVLSLPVRGVIAVKESIFDAVNVYTENEFLRRQNQRLIHMQSMATQLAVENAKLRGLLNFVPEPELQFVTARVIMEVSNSLGRAAMVNAGSRDGLEKGQIVVNDKGLVGRILEVGDTSSRVLLITDINSRVPVISSITEERGILTGNNLDNPLMKHIPIATQMEAGETITTSGDGEYYPSGLPVGTVKEMREKEAVIQPFVNVGKLEYVNIIQFKHTRLTPKADKAKKPAAKSDTVKEAPKTEPTKTETPKTETKKASAPTAHVPSDAPVTTPPPAPIDTPAPAAAH
ncbi:MAG: rod shape-determining protein MreC [Proteobacteria bacterium]|nr:rod shape-determining protein MreC [Pseudomonadota bacterium]